ncbi:hypothetical protein B1B04_24995 [Lysinibacillus sp. KCTC 33748]|uniref:hypothetical protein n=1 Tax=unclassified Lysinibacillus TaxID=2636778 RepID=UPI0009A5E8E9|nr:MULTISPECIES: hypothetical protein [unclassified Lysinibacillus]OXS65589.1 hypothetical protein B1B04_24995 [Lysinibacillus sp. KCTC 33748]SKC19648.1 hypothetical protein SAMN06295926_14510 [Lysinibacillus sp. AC-3]
MQMVKTFAEYNLLTQKKSDFYLIQKIQVICFDLFGQGMKLFFAMSDGSFNLNGRRIEIEYIDDEDGKTYHLTTNTLKSKTLSHIKKPLQISIMYKGYKNLI